jgi:hypothetical protein
MIYDVIPVVDSQKLSTVESHVDQCLILLREATFSGPEAVQTIAVTSHQVAQVALQLTPLKVQRLSNPSRVFQTPGIGAGSSLRAETRRPKPFFPPAMMATMPAGQHRGLSLSRQCLSSENPGH